MAEVEADSIDAAKALARDEFVEADFGVASDIDGEEIIIEDQNGNYNWETP